MPCHSHDISIIFPSPPPPQQTKLHFRSHFLASLSPGVLSTIPSRGKANNNNHHPRVSSSFSASCSRAFFGLPLLFCVLLSHWPITRPAGTRFFAGLCLLLQGRRTDSSAWAAQTWRSADVSDGCSEDLRDPRPGGSTMDHVQVWDCFVIERL